MNVQTLTQGYEFVGKTGEVTGSAGGLGSQLAGAAVGLGAGPSHSKAGETRHWVKS